MVDGERVFEKLPIPEAARSSFLRVAGENVRKPRVTISGNLHLTSTKPDGVGVIKKALKSALPKIENVDIELLYVGAPIYRIKVTAPDYKQAEKAIEKSAQAAIRVMEKSGDTGEFVRKQKAG